MSARALVARAAVEHGASLRQFILDYRHPLGGRVIVTHVSAHAGIIPEICAQGVWHEHVVSPAARRLILHLDSHAEMCGECRICLYLLARGKLRHLGRHQRPFVFRIAEIGGKSVFRQRIGIGLYARTFLRIAVVAHDLCCRTRHAARIEMCRSARYRSHGVERSVLSPGDIAQKRFHHYRRS